MTASVLTIDNLMEHPHVALLTEAAAVVGASCWLVGGVVRDLCVGKPVNDFDLAVQGPVEELSRSFARMAGGTFFWLDEERGQARVVVKREGLVFDIAPVKGATIEEDLVLRDFTINSMAVPLGKGPDLLDPLGGRTDLATSTIRACSADSFTNDPLRLLRAVRFAATMHFRIDPSTWEQVIEQAHLITRIAGERVRDEFFRILSVDSAGHYLFLLDEAGLLTKILPAYCRREGSIEKISDVESVIGHLKGLFPDCHEQLASYLRQETEAGITRLSLLKLTRLVGSVECTDRIALHHRLSTLSRRILARIVTSRDQSSKPLPREGRRLYRYFRDREPAGIETLVAELAVAPHDQELRDQCRALVSYYFSGYSRADQDLLLTGAQVMEILALPAGPAIGTAMESLRAAEAAGEVGTAEEAADFLRKNQLTPTEG